LEFSRQIDFSEPRIRINTEVADPRLLDWNEKDAWDELADYYKHLTGKAE
jgi:hypothetical protein